MTWSEADLKKQAAARGFQPDTLEKTARLLELLDAMRMHPFLKTRIALKGGTALNFFIFDVPRLSVDIDLNYISGASREQMLLDKPKVEQAIQGVCTRLGLSVKHVPSEHAGGKWRIGYTGISGRSGTLELDMNFMLRTPLWPVNMLDSRPVGLSQAQQVPVLDIHELAAGKIAALLARNASRDLFDTRELLKRPEIDQGKLRLAFVVYGGMNRIDWRTVGADGVRIEPEEADRMLVPMLRNTVAPARENLTEWTQKLECECRDLLSAVLPMASHEVEFIQRLNENGEIIAELLTADPELRNIITNHPNLKWKALNVRRHFGIGSGGEGADETADE